MSKRVAGSSIVFTEAVAADAEALVALRILAMRESGGLLLDHLYIDPCLQNRGIGAAVLATVFADASRCRLGLARCAAAIPTASTSVTAFGW